jgi:site-specific recombinase XerD
MKNLRLIPDIHRQQPIVKAAFAFDRELIALVKTQNAGKAKLGKPVSPDRLRHRFATHFLEHGMSLRHIQTLLGHGSSKTTEVYTHLSKKSLANIKSPLDRLIEG